MSHPGDLWTAAQGSLRELADSEHKHRNACHALIAAVASGDSLVMRHALKSAKQTLGSYAQYAPFPEDE